MARNSLSLDYSSSCLEVPYRTSDLAAADPLKSNKNRERRSINKKMTWKGRGKTIVSKNP